MSHSGPVRRQRAKSSRAHPFSSDVLNSFEKHKILLEKASNDRKHAVELRSVVTDTGCVAAVDIRDTLGVKQSQDRWQGCTNLRTLRTLLSFIDDRGFERSPHQLSFHSSFERCVSRVVYKADWATDRPAIMRHNKWDRCSSEVLIRCVGVTLTAHARLYAHSTTRSCAQYTASLRQDF